jgi:hypothetical protein
MPWKVQSYGGSGRVENKRGATPWIPNFAPEDQFIHITMDTAIVTYLGNLRTSATHVRSGETIITDAPLDNHGKGEAFQPHRPDEHFARLLYDDLDGHCR